MASVERHHLVLLIGVCVCTLSVALPRPPITPTAMDTPPQRLRSLENRLYDVVKRSCDGFPCMYSHLGAKAGRQALMRTLMSIIDDCAVDPSCSPGRRRRRRQVQTSLQGHPSEVRVQGFQ